MTSTDAIISSMVCASNRGDLQLFGWGEGIYTWMCLFGCIIFESIYNILVKDEKGIHKRSKVCKNIKVRRMLEG